MYLLYHPEIVTLSYLNATLSAKVLANTFKYLSGTCIP